MLATSSRCSCEEPVQELLADEVALLARERGERGDLLGDALLLLERERDRRPRVRERRLRRLDRRDLDRRGRRRAGTGRSSSRGFAPRPPAGRSGPPAAAASRRRSRPRSRRTAARRRTRARPARSACWESSPRRDSTSLRPVGRRIIRIHGAQTGSHRRCGRARLPQLQRRLPRPRGIRGRRVHRDPDPGHRGARLPPAARRRPLSGRDPDPARVRARRA